MESYIIKEQIDDFDNQNNENNLSQREVEDIPPLDRRFDSLAWLIQGDSRCGAAYFNGHTLFLTTNKREETTIFPIIKQHLKNIALDATKFSIDILNFSEEDQKKCVKKFVLELLQRIAYVISKADERVYLLGDISHLEDFIRSLFKVTLSIVDGCGASLISHVLLYVENEDFIKEVNSISQNLAKKIQDNSSQYKVFNKKSKREKTRTRSENVKNRMCETIQSMFSDIHDWLNPHVNLEGERGFSPELIDALKNDQGIIYLENNNKNIGLMGRKQSIDLHAEIKIIQQIVWNHSIIDEAGKIRAEVVSSLSSQYVGISKRCCLNCECALRAVNAVIEKYSTMNNFIDIRTFEGSGGKFRAAIPDFLLECAEIREKFEEDRGCDIAKAFNESQAHVDPKSERQKGSKHKKGSKHDKHKKPIKKEPMKVSRKEVSSDIEDDFWEQSDDDNIQTSNENITPGLELLVQNLTKIFIGTSPLPLDLSEEGEVSACVEIIKNKQTI